jgi:hypothetical protein
MQANKFFMTAALALSLAACATTGGTLSDAATRLDRSADQLYDQTRNDRDSRLERDAREFADVAQDFNREVKDRRSRDDLRTRFDRVANEYHDLRDSIHDDRADTREAAAFREVTRAYLDLERELQYRRVSSR